ncbi:Alpha-amylase/alpha-mannosidase, GH57 family [Nitrosomonas aestuarii]|uniref:Alpha-amylase/alpha-mannosidase, GH57 family n=1 Tax=Nitrosomonas aestuarii TaxID=52441 RepID=A0A1I3XF30_9PROT|nr:glycoside hydrolase family 57 protein [Nitrosomonas aestuarii]SFK18123.1 Alpha-amylase/alpha-mannosidase, GH57 family [Nitrosomonas aestuarii]
MQQIKLVLLWHMHQPDYRHYDTREFEMPWVYLHTIKDYTDMAHHLEAHPHIKAVVNFVPVLLDQLEDYVEQFATGQIRDPLLRLLATPDLASVSDDDREHILTNCFKGNHNTMLKPYPAYAKLHHLYDTLQKKQATELVNFSAQYFSDLLVWFHLAWTGESVRRHNATVMELMAQGEGFSHVERMRLFKLIGELIEGLIPRYRRLAETGQIELSTTPHYHPLSPLLIDFTSAHDGVADAPLPINSFYPGGRSRVTFHLNKAIDSHQKRFGTQPTGIWPAEGAVSPPFIHILAESGCQWCASGEGVLVNSLHKLHPETALPDRNRYLYRPYRIQEQENIICFFRDDKLSDFIGFEYAKWFGRDAAEHFVQSIEQIARHALPDENPVVSVILDGENAWEYYPYNGFYFLDDLYSLLDSHTGIHTTTYQDYLSSPENVHNVQVLPVLAAGSWVYGTFSTWIGDPEKNHAWDLLCTAKQNYDLVIQSDRLTDKEKTAASLQLASCESSDWFWWFGDYNQADTVIRFDQLYRDNLTNLYRLLKLPVPSILCKPISHGDTHAEEGGTMRRSS